MPSARLIYRFTLVSRYALAATLGLIAGVARAQAPTINPPAPMGIQRGTALDLALTGANLAEPVNLVASFPAKITIPTENNNGKDNAKFVAHLEVPKDAPLGWHWLRVATTRGISNFRLFCIDDLPQVLKQGGNQSIATAQAVQAPCVMCGQINAEQTDYYKFTVATGQRLSFEVLGRRLGSPIDPQITLLNPRTGKQLAFSDDAPGLSKDPRLTYTFKEAGEYVLELRDVRYQGGGDWHYRLRIGDFPCATTPVPLAAKRGSTVQVSFAGPNVEGVPPQTINVPMQPDVDAIWVSPSWSQGPAGWPVMLTVSDLEEALEVEPNDEPAKATRVQVPGAITGRFEKKGDRDHFVFTAKKGDRVLIESHTQDLHSPTSVYMVLKNAAGAQVAASNPSMDPARIDFTAPDNGDFTLAVEHLHYWGGPEETYRLTFLPHQPGFSLSVTSDRVDLPQGSGGVLIVQAVRRDYNGPIDVSVPEMTGISGSTVIREGQTAALLYLTAAPAANFGGQALVVTGKATINNRTVIEKASALALVQQGLNNLPYPPAQLGSQLALGITEKPPFALVAEFGLTEAIRGLSVPVTLTATKQTGFDEELTVASIGIPPPAGQQPAIPPVTAKIPKGQTQVKVELKPAGNAPLGAQPFTFRATAKAGGKDYAFTVPAAPLALVLPFDLKVDARGGQVAPAGALPRKTANVFHAVDLLCGVPRPIVLGTLDFAGMMPSSGKLKIKVEAVRKGGYNGPITLEVRNLPANVSAAKPTIPEKQNEIEIELTAPANAAIGDKADVNVLGTATGAGNQQSASPNFLLKITPSR